MSTTHFANLPNVSIPRTMFPFSVKVKGSMQFGTLNVIDCIPVLPGDTFNAERYSALIRMSTPIAPIMDNIECFVHAFFVPLRLLWDHTEEFYGENKTTSGPSPLNRQFPHASLFSAGVPTGSVSHQLGKPYCVADNSKTSYGIVNVLKERGYYLIWNDWFRAEQVQNPVILDTGDTGAIGTYNGVALTTATMPFPVAKKLDYYTACTLSPVYATAQVTLPLGTSAPVFGGPRHALQSDILGDYIPTNWVKINGTDISGSHNFYTTDGVMRVDNSVITAPSNNNGVAIDNLYADLSQATAATINSLRYAFAVQKWLERANFGSRFFEVLAVHYGVTSPDARLQRPEYLGGLSHYINIDQVLQTTGHVSGATTQLGVPGANSTTGIHRPGFFTKAFVEPGFVYILTCTKQDQTYSQGIMCEDAKLDLFDQYFPEFDGLGDKQVIRQELKLTGTAADLQSFGSQEHWAEYKYRPQRVHGLLDPNVPNSLDFWTLANKFANQPSLDAQFIEENRDNISRALTTGNSGPDFICDWIIDMKVVRPMHAYPEYLRSLESF